jgi:hypothetical protein
MYLLEIERMDLGADVRAVGLDLTEDDQNREPARGLDAARIWSRVLGATAGEQPWALDFFSHIERVRDYCDRHQIPYRQPTGRSIVVPAPETARLEVLIDRFQSETFGARAGGPVSPAAGEDPELERELARRGLDAYHAAFPRYFFCAICGFEDGSLVLLSEKLWASEVIRRVRPAVEELKVEVRLPA